MYIFNPTLKSLKEKLNIKSINSGKTLINSYGLVSDDIERLYPFVGINGCVHFKSGTEFSSIQYRGQNEDYGVCKDRKSTRLNSSHLKLSRMPSSA